MDLNTKLVFTFVLIGFSSGWLTSYGSIRGKAASVLNIVFSLSWIGLIASALAKIWL